RCVDAFNVGNPICAPGQEISRPDLLRYRAPVLRAFAQIATQVDRVTVWDPFSLLCPADPCTAMRDGHPLFYDGDHVSGYANRMIAPEFEQWIEQLTGSAATTHRD